MPPKRPRGTHGGASSSSQAPRSPSPPHSPQIQSSPPERPNLPRLIDIRPPWPKMEHLKIRMRRQWDHDPKTETESSECLNRPISEDWDEYDTLFYNAWLSVEIRPTRFIDYHTIRDMGIKDDVLMVLRRIGLGTLATKPYDLFPDLVRQFLATCSVYYTNEQERTAQGAVLTFMLKGSRYRVSIPNLCGIYGFKKTPTRVDLTPEWHDIQRFWSYIAHTVYDSRESRQTEVAHPVLRYVLRVLGNTILCKAEPNKMRRTELILLHHGIGHLFPEETWDWPHPSEDLNMGAVFAHHLCTLKSKAFRGKKVESVGSLLTPIFRYFDIITSDNIINSSRLFLDSDHLKNATWMKPTLLWVFADRAGRDWSIKLPQPGLTTITEDLSLLSFQPAAGLLQTVPRRKLRRGSSSSAAPSAIEDEMVDAPSGSQPLDLQFPEPPPGYTEDSSAFRQYMVNTMRKMWHLLAASVSCTRPPSQARRRRQRSPTPDPATVAGSDDDQEDD